MAFDHYIRSDGRELRMGFTTGTCAALASAGAAQGLLTGHIPQTLRLITPKGLEVSVQPAVRDMDYGDRKEEESPVFARCGVVKDAGDDPDATNGLLILAQAELWNPGPAGDRIRILGGEGIGRVTKPGLDQNVGEAAINSVPRQMIRREVLRVCSDFGYMGGMTITISAPDGKKAAEKTLNEKVGIVGGISIIGTSGIVEPVSRKAYADTVRLLIRQAAIEDNISRTLILTPGNYGLSFLKQAGYDRAGVPVVVCSNYIGDALDEAVANGFERILLVGHAGKLVKLAAGIMNTHSSVADGRTEIFTAHAAMAGASAALCRRLMDAATADACIFLLREEGIDRKVFGSILERAQRYLDARCRDALCGMIIFSNQYGELGRTDRAGQITEWIASRQAEHGLTVPDPE